MSAMSDSLDELDTSCSLGKKATIFREGKGDVRTLSGGDHALITLHSPYQPPGAVHNRTATTAAALCRGNRKCRQGEDMQMNVVQNSFPDLFTSECLLPWTKNSATQQPTEDSSMNFQARRVTLPAITPLCLQKRMLQLPGQVRTVWDLAIHVENKRWMDGKRLEKHWITTGQAKASCLIPR